MWAGTWIDTFGSVAGRGGEAWRQQPSRRRTEQDGCDLLHTGKRDQNERHQQDDAEPEREGGAGHKVMAVPECKDRRNPGADRMRREGQQQRLAQGGAHDCQDR